VCVVSYNWGLDRDRVKHTESASDDEQRRVTLRRVHLQAASREKQASSITHSSARITPYLVPCHFLDNTFVASIHKYLQQISPECSSIRFPPSIPSPTSSNYKKNPIATPDPYPGPNFPYKPLPSPASIPITSYIPYPSIHPDRKPRPIRITPCLSNTSLIAPSRARRIGFEFDPSTCMKKTCGGCMHVYIVLINPLS